MLLLAILSLALLSFSSLAEAAPWSFAVLGDQRDANGAVGINTPVVQAMASDIFYNRGVSLVLCGGDQIHGHHGSTEASLPTMYAKLAQCHGADLGHLLPGAGQS